MNNKQETLCAVASGSGGHILPALIVSNSWHKQHPQGDVIFCTGTSSLDKKILENYPFISSIINFSIAKFSPKKIWLYPIILLQILWSLGKSFWIIIKHRPTKIVSTGGLIAIPLCLAGRLLGSKIEIYELNVVPGKAVKLLMPLAHIIHIPFKATQKHCHAFGMNFERKCRPCNYPIRFTEQDKNIDKLMVIKNINTMITKDSLPFETSRKTIFLLGGSQGSLMLNNALKQFLQIGVDHNTLQSIQVIHQTGNLDNFNWADFYQKLGIPALTFSYYEHVKDFYGLANLVICRAGAGTIFEVAFFGKPCIVIPLIATSTSHQVDNAREISAQYPHLFTMIEQRTVATNPALLYQTILDKI